MGDVHSFWIERDVLNQKLGGGFPSGSLVLAKGASSSGKSITCQRICFGLLENDVSVTYISTQLTTKGFIFQMQTLDYSIAKHLTSGRLLFIPVLPLTQKIKPRSNFIHRLIAAKSLFTNNAIIIDTISSLISHSIDKQKTTDLVNFLKKTVSFEKTIILAIDTDMLDPEVMNLFSSASNIYLELKKNLEMGDLRYTIFVNKFASTQTKVTQIIGFLIEYRSPTHHPDDQQLRIRYYDMKNEAHYKR
ncbi:MAG: ATPase [Methanosarcinales archaeon]|nr:MAG: ATPase [Methanosarcinales archaeon]